MSASSLQLFGTDGIRGVANIPPLTSEIILQVGRAVAHYVKTADGRTEGPHKILIGKDTRLSGYMLEWALASGINSMGVDVLLVGPLPTPGIAFLTVSMRAHAGIVISASHNPFQDNGIKVFGSDGYKLAEDDERHIERLIHSGDIDALRPTATDIGKAYRVDDAPGRYIQFTKATFPTAMTLDGLTIALDCAHGAAYRVAPTVLEELGATVTPVGIDPNGENINDGVGSLHPEAVAEIVTREGADVGIALDGDADRVILVDEHGAIVDGDQVMAVCALAMAQQGGLKKNTVVGTVMSNIGLELFLREHDIGFVRAPVGDRHVVHAMTSGGYNFGGEQSGHIIFLDHCTTGDGLVGALQVMAVMLRTGKPLSAVGHQFEPCPQVLRNVRVREKKTFADVPPVVAAIESAQAELGEEGRVLVRYSGTEALARVMVEGAHADTIETLCNNIAEVIDAQLGVGA